MALLGIEGYHDCTGLCDIKAIGSYREGGGRGREEDWG